MKTTPFWSDVTLPFFPALKSDLDVDVVVIGAGLTGITAAYLLADEGISVALIERGRCAAADTGHTTAHLTFVTDYRLHRLVKSFGNDGARAFWDAGAVAIDEIERIVAREGIECDFKRVPGYLHAALPEPGRKEVRLLKKDAQLADELRFDACFIERVPFVDAPGVVFGNQARFHPRKYLAPLLERIRKNGGRIFEHSEAASIEDEPLAVRVGEHAIRCRFVVVATHNPIAGKTPLLRATLFQTKLALYTSYVVAASVRKGSVPEGLYWDTNDPYNYLRVDKRAEDDFIVAGGCDVKTGQGDDRDSFARVEQSLRARLPDAQITHRWLGQVIETNDGLPFIGEISENQFVATGYCGNGFTLGTIAAMMARDRFLGRENIWNDVFDVNRRKLRGGTWRYVTENVDYPFFLLRDRLSRAEARSVREVPRGEGRIAVSGKRKVAAYRDTSGRVTKLNPSCTHLGCNVRWNAADKTWDCPCHGSRFGRKGEVLAGPAEADLKRIR